MPSLTRIKRIFNVMWLPLSLILDITKCGILFFLYCAMRLGMELCEKAA